jgi:ubiquinone/menaquinone biosynthesis C-methylase UbiE
MVKRLNFGCGTDIKGGWDNCDVQKNEKVIHCDGDVFPYPFKSNIYEYVLLREVLEYLESPDKVLFELWRISKQNGTIEIEVPYYNNKGAFNDIVMKHYFNDVAFKVFVNQHNNLNKERKFEIIELTLRPTHIGRFFPKIMREKLSVFIGGLIGKITVKLKVIK